VFLTYFFRDPERHPPEGENLLVAPGDGKVLLADTRKDASGGATSQVSIFLSVFDVHINRIPVSGKITEVDYRPGRFHRAFEERAMVENERNDVTIASAFGKVTVSQVAGILARRIVCRIHNGDRVVRGQRYGLIRFGSRIDLVCDQAIELRVKPGDHVKGGETVIGVLRDDG
jgi:phosphatidylserine decarboxylase